MQAGRRTDVGSESQEAPRPPGSAGATAAYDDRVRGSPRTSRPSRYYSWSELMSRVFKIDVLQCPRCQSGPMRILAAIHPPTTTRAILTSLGLPTRAPPIAPARPVSSDWTMAEPSAERGRFSSDGSRPAA